MAFAGFGVSPPLPSFMLFQRVHLFLSSTKLTFTKHQSLLVPSVLFPSSSLFSFLPFLIPSLSPVLDIVGNFCQRNRKRGDGLLHLQAPCTLPPPPTPKSHPAEQTFPPSSQIPRTLVLTTGAYQINFPTKYFRIYVYTNTYVRTITINVKGSHKFEGEWGYVGGLEGGNGRMRHCD